MGKRKQNMAGILALRSYGSDSDSDHGDPNELVQHLKPIESTNAIGKELQLVVAPEITSTKELDDRLHIDPLEKELKYNPKYEELYAPVMGPVKNETDYHKVKRNTLAGHVEEAHFNAFDFESQRRTFAVYGYAVDPSVADVPDSCRKYVGDVQTAEETQGITIFETKKKEDRPKKRKTEKNNDAGDIDGYKGPWAKYENEQTVMKPPEEEQHELDEILAKRQKRGKNTDDKPIEEKTLLHIK